MPSGALGTVGQLDAEASRLALPALVFASAASQLGFVIANPILLDIARSFHTSVPIVAQGRTVQSAGSAVMALAATLIADRFPRRRLLLLGLAVMSITGVTLAVTDAFPVWMLVQVLSGAAAGLVTLSASTAVGEYVPEHRRGAAMGYIAAGLGLAWLLGLPVVGFMAGTFGWRFAYGLIGGGTAIACGIAVAVALPTIHRPFPTGTHVLSGWRELLSQRAAKGLLIGDALTGTAWSGFLVYLGPFFGLVYAMRPSAIGTMLSLASIVGVCGMLSAAPLARTFGRPRLLAGVSVLAAAAITMPLSVKVTPLFSLAVLIPHIFLNCVRFPTSGAIALSLLPTARGTMMAARSFTISAAGMTGSLICGLLLTLGGFSAIGWGCAALTIVGAFGYTRSLADRLPPKTMPAMIAATE